MKSPSPAQARSSPAQSSSLEFGRAFRGLGPLIDYMGLDLGLKKPGLSPQFASPKLMKLIY